MTETAKPKRVGINRTAIEVGDMDAARAEEQGR
jgi:hypothetical protein